ncbi:OLC1v1024407C1 [Oldenlandia corymbosa var. corymbosa]|uniref:OLC1v1024407C1 n=1 Tax=Oldenlandia corymbosa var. corymbosa TaxID=529605 RepID=A0AAV1C5A6_OLDCO|nr:OLC1v1024407C1 [Oldenlandia corymbosa var. corymbosa]
MARPHIDFATSSGISNDRQRALVPTIDATIECVSLSKRHYALGRGYVEPPHFLSEYIPQSVSPPTFNYFPYLLHQPAFTTPQYWPWCDSSIHTRWVKWLERLKPHFESEWKSLKIFYLIMFCRDGIPFCPDLMAAATFYWSHSSNVFMFPCGPMSVTLLDLCMITGLAPFGETRVDIMLSADLRNLDHQTAQQSYDQYMDAHNQEKDIPTVNEHTEFLAIWLNRYVFCSRSMQMTSEFINVAYSLAKGQKLDLCTALLTNFYRSMYELCSNPQSHMFGPLWILPLWVYCYFPDVRPKNVVIPIGRPICSAFQNSEIPNISYESFFRRFYEATGDKSPAFNCMTSHLTVGHWFPSFGPTAATQVSIGPRDRSAFDGIDQIWASFLTTRDIFCGFCPLNESSANLKMWCEFYPSNFCARQFGFFQIAPNYDYSCWQTWRSGRYDLDLDEYNVHLSHQLVRMDGFKLPDFNPTLGTMPGFDYWWRVVCVSLNALPYSELLQIAKAVPSQNNSPRPKQPAEEDGNLEAEPLSLIEALRSSRRTAFRRKLSPSKFSNSQDNPFIIEDDDDEPEQTHSASLHDKVSITGDTQSSPVMKSPTHHADAATISRKSTSSSNLGKRGSAFRAVTSDSPQPTSQYLMSFEAARSLLPDYMVKSAADIFGDDFDGVLRVLKALASGPVDDSLKADLNKFASTAEETRKSYSTNTAILKEYDQKSAEARSLLDEAEKLRNSSCNVESEMAALRAKKISLELERAQIELDLINVRRRLDEVNGALDTSAAAAEATATRAAELQKANRFLELACAEAASRIKAAEHEWYSLASILSPLWPASPSREIALDVKPLSMVRPDENLSTQEKDGPSSPAAES